MVSAHGEGSQILCSVARSGATLLNLAYGYFDNGQVQQVTDALDGLKSEKYAYDALHRLFTAQRGPDASIQRKYEYDYDRYGNRRTQTVTAGTQVPSNLVNIDPLTNRIIGAPYSYDAAGNLTNDGLNTLVYDGENRVTSSTNANASATYSYDGNGLRVRKEVGGPNGATTVYIFSGTKVIAEYENGAAPASPTREYIYSGSMLLATIEGSVAKYQISDHLSARVTTDSTGTVVGQRAHYPFGETWYETGTTTKWQFTSYERDAESGNDYALARYHINRLGRFSSPDPLAGSILDPQSLNRYAYVRNDPVNLIDPLGLDHHMQVICTLDGIETDCGFALGLLLSGAAGLGPSGPGWVPAGGDYRGSGCFTNRVTDQVWCPPAVSIWFRPISSNLRPVDPNRPGGDRPAPQPPAPRSDIERLVVGLNNLTTPLQNAAVSGAFFVAGAVVVGASGLATVGACTTVVACAIVAPFTVGTGVVGGGALFYGGYRYTVDVTIPSFKRLYQNVRR